MLGVYDAIRARRTIRDFAPRPVESAVLERILEAGLRAPVHDVKEGRRFLLVSDPDKRSALVRGFHQERTPEQVAALVDSWAVEDPIQRAMFLDGIPKQASMLLTAAVLVIPCFRQPEPLLEAKTSLHELNAFAEVWACIQNLLVAAAAEGVFGVTKIPSTPAESNHVRRTLGIPEDYEPACYLALGYPAIEAARFTPRLEDLDSYLFRDMWGHSAG